MVIVADLLPALHLVPIELVTVDAVVIEIDIVNELLLIVLVVLLAVVFLINVSPSEVSVVLLLVTTVGRASTAGAVVEIVVLIRLLASLVLLMRVRQVFVPVHASAAVQRGLLALMILSHRSWSAPHALLLGGLGVLVQRSVVVMIVAWDNAASPDLRSRRLTVWVVVLVMPMATVPQTLIVSLCTLLDVARRLHPLLLLALLSEDAVPARLVMVMLVRAYRASPRRGSEPVAVALTLVVVVNVFVVHWLLLLVQVGP